MRASRRSLVVALVAPAAMAASGGIARSLTITSDPAGAEVRLNGTPVGATPVTVPFRHYGVYRVELRKDGFATVEAPAPVLAPGYARFPLGLFSALLWPGVIRDDRYLAYELGPQETPDREGLLERAATAAGRKSD